jgi:hypothetical protein
LSVTGFPAAIGFFTAVAELGELVEVLFGLVLLATVLLATVLLATVLVDAVAVLGSSFFAVSSNAGFGTGRSFGAMRVNNDAGLTLPAVSAFAMPCLAGAGFSISGFTMI